VGEVALAFRQFLFFTYVLYFQRGRFLLCLDDDRIFVAKRAVVLAVFQKRWG